VAMNPNRETKNQINIATPHFTLTHSANIAYASRI
jgi:hypothetical protein